MAVLTEEIFARKKQVLILAEKKETRPSQISLLYVLNQKVNMAAIIGPRSKQEMDDVIRTTSERFTQEEIDYLTLERGTLLDQRCLRAFQTNPFKNIGEATQGLLRRCFYENRCEFSEQDSPEPCAAGTCWSTAFPLES